ncbi:hypothetical protein [Sedimenticola hydrogenitrophicus]|uniref:hypothetical protein n=1 Tax=Sedimenticola hydrogenitrophicus TaxID=2967975 RepID=UPI0021A74964|nr:hypothetical protein [Sedimenticola hydrogenitrophicus]
MQSQQNRCGNVLCIYAGSQTYTTTVFEHLDAFRKYSKHSWTYLDIQDFNHGLVTLELFDAVFLHYSVRLPFGQVSDVGLEKLRKFRGLRALFIQDEYDGTNTVKQIINSTPFDLVFSVVPKHSLGKIYPLDELPRTKFVNNLTGYVPDDLLDHVGQLTAPSTRFLTIAYRGRQLPIRYGRLGQEKVAIGRYVRDYCRKHGFPCDIEWDESSRIYGEDWYRFIGSAKAMLGSESGSNVFDWDGSLQNDIECYRKKWPKATDQDIYRDVIEKHEIDGLMNQISPRIFEMAAAKTVMVLFEGSYSGVLEPFVHFIPLKKDFSNLDQVVGLLGNGMEVDAMAGRAYRDIILSEKYSYRLFVNMVDSELKAMFEGLELLPIADARSTILAQVKKATQVPVKSKPPLPVLTSPFTRAVGRFVIAAWQRIPVGVRPYIKRLLGRA